MLIILGIALSEIASIIEEKVLHDKQTPVFYVKDLKKMYQNRLKTLGASEIMIQNVNVTRMKEDLLEQVPGLREQRDGKYVILTVDDEFGRALIQCSQNTMKEDGIIISKAAKIVRRCMFKEDEIFDGNLSSRKQKSSVSVTLLRLVSLIMNGENSEENVSTAVEFKQFCERKTTMFWISKTFQNKRTIITGKDWSNDTCEDKKKKV